MAFFKGPALLGAALLSATTSDNSDWVKGGIYLVGNAICVSIWYILQVLQLLTDHPPWEKGDSLTHSTGGGASGARLQVVPRPSVSGDLDVPPGHLAVRRHGAVPGAQQLPGDLEAEVVLGVPLHPVRSKSHPGQLLRRGHHLRIALESALNSHCIA